MPLSALDDLVFGGWDIFEDDCYAAARTAGVIEPSLLEQVRPDLEKIRPWPAVFDQRYVKRLDGPNVKKGKNKKDLAEQVTADIRRFKSDHDLDRLVMVTNCGSTEVFMTGVAGACQHRELRAGTEGERPGDSLEHGLCACAAIHEGIPAAQRGAQSTADIPALVALAARTRTPLAGKDRLENQARRSSRPSSHRG